VLVFFFFFQFWGLNIPSFRISLQTLDLSFRSSNLWLFFSILIMTLLFLICGSAWDWTQDLRHSNTEPHPGSPVQFFKYPHLGFVKLHFWYHQVPMCDSVLIGSLFCWSICITIHILKFIQYTQSMVANIYNPSTYEAESAGFQVSGQPGLHQDPVLSQKWKKKSSSMYVFVCLLSAGHCLQHKECSGKLKVCAIDGTYIK
jgi:hypothetical protein